MIDYKKELNSEQLKVVQDGDGYCLVLAGAGSGKTRTLVYRVAYLLEKGVSPDQLMLVTFTNKAAKEMMKRIELIWGSKPKGFWGGTFHHLGNRLLRHYASTLGYPLNFTILDQDDCHQLIKSVLGDLEIKPDKYFPKADLLRDIISYAYNSQKTIEEVMLDRYRHLSPDIISTIQTINQKYQEKKRQLGLMDFDDLLTNWYLLLRNPLTGEIIADQFKYILVDEYQDTNKIQGAITSLLSLKNKNLLVVGDDAQSIYSFRAATVSNILNFPKVFIGAQIFKLETNYRSTPGILNLANESISLNPEQFPKDLKSVKTGTDKPILVAVRDQYHQAEFIVDKVMELHRDGLSLNEIAILSRSTYQNLELELEINKRRIPYEVRGGLRFFEQAHIKDVLAFLRIFNNHLDEISWKRILSLQSGIGPAMANRVWQAIFGLSADIEEILMGLATMVLPTRADEGLKNLLSIIGTVKSAEKVSDKIQAILGSSYENYLRGTYENASERIEDLTSLANFATNYQSLEAFLSDSALAEGFKGERAKDYREGVDETLVISTIHQAKGLEWKAVFVVGLVEGQFPHYKVYEKPAELSEERRLFYVAVTRAQEQLFLLYPLMSQSSGMGLRIGRPSMFISELKEKFFERLQIVSDPSTGIFLEKSWGNDFWRDTDEKTIEY